MNAEGNTGHKRVRSPHRASTEIKARTKHRFRTTTASSGHFFNNFKGLNVEQHMGAHAPPGLIDRRMHDGRGQLQGQGAVSITPGFGGIAAELGSMERWLFTFI